MNWNGLLAAIGIGTIAAFRFHRSNDDRLSPIHGLPNEIYEGYVPQFQAIAESYRASKPNLARAAELAIQGQIDKSLELFDSNLSLRTSDPELCVVACQVYRALWMEKHVEKFVLRGLELTPGQVDWLIKFHGYFPNNINDALKTHALTVGDCLKAVTADKYTQFLEYACTKRALELEPNNGEMAFRYVKSVIYGDMGDDYYWYEEEADELFAKAHVAAVQLPENADVAHLLADMYDSYAYCVNGDYADAFKWIDRAIELDPNNPSHSGLKQDIMLNASLKDKS